MYFRFYDYLPLAFFVATVSSKLIRPSSTLIDASKPFLVTFPGRIIAVSNLVLVMSIFDALIFAKSLVRSVQWSL